MKNLYLMLVTACIFSSSNIFAQISKETNDQIAALMLEKNSRTPAQKKISSQLLQAVRESRGQKMAPGTFLDPANVHADAQGNLEVDIKADVSDTLLLKITSVGGKIINFHPQYRAIRASVNLSIVETIAGLPGIIFIAPARRAQVSGPGIPGRSENISPEKKTTTAEGIQKVKEKNEALRKENIRKRLISYFNLQRTFSGTANSEGDRAHKSDAVRALYGYEGQGIRIGVLSDSYNNKNGAATDVATGNLPGPGNPFGNTTAVTVLSDLASGGSDEGRAMLQIVHDVAPKAQLYFATAYNTQADFATNIIALRTAGCSIIIDDVGYFAESVFQDGTVASAVNTVTAGGAMYFSSAGNEGSVLKGTAGVYEADFNDNNAAPVTLTNPTGPVVAVGTLHVFGTNPYDVTSATSSIYNLHWSDPNGTSANDYDLFLENSAGTVKAASTDVQAGIGADPYEEIFPGTVSTSDRLVVLKKTGAAVRTIHLNTNRGRLSVSTTGQTHGHSCAVNAFCVAATPAATPYTLSASYGPFPNGFVATNTLETFSSDGPRRIYYNENGTPVTAGVFTIAAGGGTVLNKPDITAADGVTTTLPASTFLNPFYGTSAAAPHAGAIAALLKSGNAALTNAQIRTIIQNSAVDIAAAGVDVNSGYGIIRALDAANLMNTVPALNLVSKTIIDGNFSNQNNFVDPGEQGEKLIIKLKNPTVTNATSVTAVLSAATTGITITQNTSSYGTIAGSASADNSGSPFLFNVDAATVCGTTINFVLNVTYSGGGASPQVYDIRIPVGNRPADSVFAVLGTPTASANYVTATGTQSGRINRSGYGTFSVCGTQKATPSATTGSRTYDSYRFTNTNSAAECVTVSINSSYLLFGAVYNNSGFVPTTPAVNYLADPGYNGTTQDFGFNVPAGNNFTVVVFEYTGATAVGAPYGISVSYSACAGNLVLPVSWLGFTAREKNKQSLLTWKVANELNAAGYNVEYSTDGRNFEKINYVPAIPGTASEKTYSWLHPNPVNGNNYYRIREIDNDGRASLSSTQIVTFKDKASIVISPNPTASDVNIRASMNIQSVQLFNTTGQLLEQIKVFKNNYSLSLSKYPAGQYLLRVQTDSEVINEKLIKL